MRKEVRIGLGVLGGLSVVFGVLVIKRLGGTGDLPRAAVHADAPDQSTSPSVDAPRPTVVNEPRSAAPPDTSPPTAVHPPSAPEHSPRADERPTAHDLPRPRVSFLPKRPSTGSLEADSEGAGTDSSSGAALPVRRSEPQGPGDGSEGAGDVTGPSDASAPLDDVAAAPAGDERLEPDEAPVELPRQRLTARVSERKARQVPAADEDEPPQRAAPAPPGEEDAAPRAVHADAGQAARPSSEAGSFSSGGEDDSSSALESAAAPPEADETSAASRRAEAAAARRARGDRVYVVEQGDTLADIARFELGDPRRWKEIVALNRDVLSDELREIKAGVKLLLPAYAR